MRFPTSVFSVCLLTTGLVGCLFTIGLAVPTVSAQTPVPSDAECKMLRERLADHGALSEGVRRAVAAQVAAAPATPGATAPTAGPVDTRRARVDAIAAERKAAEEQRLGAMVKLDFSRAAQLQAKIQELDAEKANLEREMASGAASPGPAPAPAPAAGTVADASRVRCQDVRALLDSAVKIRQRELGAREGQSGAVPLVALKGQTSEQIAQEVGAQLPATGLGAVGLLDADGDARLDAIVDVPTAGVYRVVRRRADGTLTVEAFAAGGSGAAYGELIRRLDEATMRQTNQTLEGVLATRPAGSIRVVGETGEFANAHRRLLAAEFGEVAKLDGPAVRSIEYENFRGDLVRTIETIAAVDGGVLVRRVVIVARRNENELWDETTTIIRPVSYWRTEVQIARSQETRTPAGAPVGQRTVSSPVKIGLER